MGHSINAEVINGQLNVVLGESTPIIMTLLQKYDIEVVVNDGINIATFNMEYTR